jgi:hypothetical protein
MKEKIDIMILGNIPYKGLFRNISKWKSEIFEISISSSIKNLPDPSHEMEYLNQSFMDSQLMEIMGPDSDRLRIGIIFADLESNFYVRRISDKSAVISIKTTQFYLNAYNISTENFVLRTIYLIYILYLETKQQFTIEAYKIPHIETRGCLFDLNGLHSDVIHNTEQPIICEQCYARLSNKQLPNNLLNNLKKELKKIRKKRRERLELFIKNQPYLSILISIFFGILLNILANFIYDAIKPCICPKNDNVIIEKTK